MIEQLRGLYAITDAELLAEHQLLTGVEQAILGGARVIQYRDKSADSAKRLRQASELLQLCQQHSVPLIINDDVALAAAVGADGVHLGKDDAELDKARAQLPTKALIGVSCYNDPQLAQQAAAAGADYIAFGAFFPSTTKPEAVRAEASLLQEAKQHLKIPLVAIGGITAENGTALVDAGADMLAVITGIFGQTNIQQSAAAYARLFNQKKRR